MLRFKLYALTQVFYRRARRNEIAEDTRRVEQYFAEYADNANHRRVSAEVLLMSNRELISFLHSDNKYASIAAVELTRRFDAIDQTASMFEEDLYSLIHVGEVS
jgi:hypothetical protein